ncbi:MAG: XdhC/CoxI family protein [Dehalococcoidia bacterium]
MSELMAQIAAEVLAAIAGGRPVVTAAVIAAPDGGAVRVGDKMLVRPDGSRLGGLGGSALEDAVVEVCLAAIPRHEIGARRFTNGGEIVEDRHDPSDYEIMIEVVEAPAKLVVVGGGHIGRSLCTIAAMAGFSITVIDDRPEYANQERFPEADRVICDDFEDALAGLESDSNTYYVMVTRGHKQDELSLRMVLTKPSAYVGMIGSKRRTGAVLLHLEEEGYARDLLDRVSTPIGLDIGAETPEEIAISIVAELIMVRRGGTGMRMYYRRGHPADRLPVS